MRTKTPLMKGTMSKQRKPKARHWSFRMGPDASAMIQQILNDTGWSLSTFIRNLTYHADIHNKNSYKMAIDFKKQSNQAQKLITESILKNRGA